MSALPTSSHSQTTPDDSSTTAPSGVVFWLTAAFGAAIVAFGVRGAWINEPRGFSSAAKWFIGGALIVDLIVVPVGAALGWGAKRVVPAWTWPVVRTVLFTSVILVVFAAPLVLDKGGVPGNPTVRPRNYELGLAVALGATWLFGAVALTAKGLTAHRQRRTTT